MTDDAAQEALEAEVPGEPEAPPKLSFHAAILHSTGEFGVESYATVAELANRLKGLINQDVSVFPFHGDRLHISRGPLRHLLVPGMLPVQLYEVPATLEPDETGYLGVDPVLLSDPPQLRVPRPRTQAQALPEDFFGGDSGTVLGAFDDALPNPEA